MIIIPRNTETRVQQTLKEIQIYLMGLKKHAVIIMFFFALKIPISVFL